MRVFESLVKNNALPREMLPLTGEVSVSDEFVSFCQWLPSNFESLWSTDPLRYVLDVWPLLARVLREEYKWPRLALTRLGIVKAIEGKRVRNRIIQFENGRLNTSFWMTFLHRREIWGFFWGGAGIYEAEKGASISIPLHSEDIEIEQVQYAAVIAPLKTIDVYDESSRADQQTVLLNEVLFHYSNQLIRKAFSLGGPLSQRKAATYLVKELEKCGDISRALWYGSDNQLSSVQLHRPLETVLQSLATAVETYVLSRKGTAFVCWYCGTPGLGRPDQKFCTQSCRNSYSRGKRYLQSVDLRALPEGVMKRFTSGRPMKEIISATKQHLRRARSKPTGHRS